MKKLLFYILSLCLIYVYLHNPILALTGIGAIKFLYLLIPFLLVPNAICLIKQNQNILSCYLIILIYCILITLVGGSPTFIYTTIVAIIECFFLPILLFFFIQKWDVKFHDVLLGVMIVSCLITCLSLFIPSFHLFISNLIVKQDVLIDLMTYRGFGLSDGLTYGYGVILALMGGVFLLYLEKYKWIYVLLPILGLSILVNARVGGLILILNILIFCGMNFVKGMKFFALFCVVLYIFSFVNITFESDLTTDFIKQFFLELGDFVGGTDNARGSTADVIFNDFLVWPRTFEEWVVGRGYSVFLATDNSDIGFIIQLNV